MYRKLKNWAEIYGKKSQTFYFCPKNTRENVAKSPPLQLCQSPVQVRDVKEVFDEENCQYTHVTWEKDRMYRFHDLFVRRSPSKISSIQNMMKTWRSHPHLRYDVFWEVNALNDTSRLKDIAQTVLLLIERMENIQMLDSSLT